MTINRTPTLELIFLYASTFLLRVGFESSLILFDWMLVWGIEDAFGHENASSFSAILLTAFAGITFLVAEVMFTGYYGNRSDRVGAKPVILFATFGAAFALLMYAPASFIYSYFSHTRKTAILLLVLYLATVHFIHGVVAAANVAPALGFVNHLSTNKNRSLHMAWYDNAIFYGRAVGMTFGGFLWIGMGVDNPHLTLSDQAMQIAKTFPFLFVLLLIATLVVYFGLSHPQKTGDPKPFSLKEDITIAFRVMLEPSRRALLVPWLAIAALIGSASLWGPSVTFRASAETGGHRGLDALLPIMGVMIALALPAPLWGWYADQIGRKRVLQFGISGLPAMGIGLLLGFPFFRGQASISNPIVLLSIMPGLMLMSALAPVMMSRLGDTARQNVREDGHVMSGYHFVLAGGEILGILAGGIVIGLFAMFHEVGLIRHISTALVSGFLFFEVAMLLTAFIGIWRLPE